MPERVGPDELLVVMGGPMGVGDVVDARYPFLAREIILLREAIARDRPVLGICLGAQLLAAAAGARVYPNTRRAADGAVVLAPRGGLGARRLRVGRARAGARGAGRARDGAALARRHLRSAARRRAPRLDVRLPQSGVSPRVEALRACSSTASWRPRPSPSGCARTPPSCARPTARTAARAHPGRHRAPLRRRAPGLGSPAAQHHRPDARTSPPAVGREVEFGREAPTPE